MKIVNIVPDPFNKDTWYSAEVDDVCLYLTQQFGKLPENTKIYHNQIVENSDFDVTPKNEDDIARLQGLDGVFYVIIYPAEIFTIVAWAIMAITAAFSIYTYMTMPKIAVSAPQSANNDLASRQNQSRLNGRIPEIFGTLRSTPDLIAAPFTYYDSEFREIEDTVMCMGRGYHKIHDCREDQTDVHDINGSSVSVYDPEKSIIGAPIYQVGDDFTEPPLYVIKSKSINGQTLDRPNDQKVESDNIYFDYPNKITSSTPMDFGSMFAAGDSIGVYGAIFGFNDVQMSGSTIFTSTKRIVITSPINITSPSEFKGVLVTAGIVEATTTIPPVPPETEPTIEARVYDLSGQYSVSSVSKVSTGGEYQYTIVLSNPSAINPNWDFITSDATAFSGVKLNNNTDSLNLDGSYEVASVSGNTILLNNPAQSNSDWNDLALLQNQTTLGMPSTVRLDKLDNAWVGWHNLRMPNCEQIIFNFFFQNGLFYQDSKGGVWEESMEVVIEYQKLNSSGQPEGSIFTSNHVLRNRSKSAFGTTVRTQLQFVGAVRFRVARTTPTKNDKTQDLCKIKDVYAASVSNILNYGDVTIIRAKTVGTDGALSLKERKLNLLVTRMLKVNGTGVLQETNSAGQALINLALDKYNGRREIHEVDIDQIVSEMEEIGLYFGTDEASEFSYTFDDSNLSFEEIAGMIASTCFSECYRFGNKIRIKFEKPQDDSVLLFNHRNKQPDTEKRTRRCGNTMTFDGIELEYTSPEDDARIVYYIPSDGSATNAMSVKTSGIRSDSQAMTRAWREWNKLKFHRRDVEFGALSESEILLRNDRVLVADNTNQKTQDGDIEGVDGLTLFTSQPVIFESGISYCYLQLPNGTVDMIQCSAGVDEYEIVLSRAPKIEIIYQDGFNKAKYLVVSDDTKKYQTFMVSEISPSDSGINTLTLANYDERFYQNDLDFFI